MFQNIQKKTISTISDAKITHFPISRKFKTSKSPISRKFQMVKSPISRKFQLLNTVVGVVQHSPRNNQEANRKHFRKELLA